MSSVPPIKPPAVYEFSHKKRWADLLVAELSDAIVLVLSPAARVLFCSRAVHEILGWMDDDVLEEDTEEGEEARLHLAAGLPFGRTLLQPLACTPASKHPKPVASRIVRISCLNTCSR